MVSLLLPVQKLFLYDESVFYGSRGQKPVIHFPALMATVFDVHEHFNGKSWLL